MRTPPKHRNSKKTHQAFEFSKCSNRLVYADILVLSIILENITLSMFLTGDNFKTFKTFLKDWTNIQVDELIETC